ncbi:hypothetical protein C4553_01680 [Candidatus Parcubacteria bacterium]|nr:MAG: hypothetical protein C4553_01680 [Candidatus Parcubacteria bacterium]
MFLRRIGFYGVVDDTEVLGHFVIVDGLMHLVGLNQQLPTERCAVVDPKNREIVGYWDPKEWKSNFFVQSKSQTRYTLCRILPSVEEVSKREKQFDEDFLRSLNITPNIEPE